ncbi:MAG: SOS response-associated peptidase [Acholeplasmataceae bacterium]|jgi:putative SOS response-associated peptidase YedK|nr:SOS response-associated peptidase [Acholeplasmataceae bacterium]
MCGRFTINLTNDQLRNYLAGKYQVNKTNNFSIPRYNVAPGTNIIAVIFDGVNYRVGELKWGFIPSFKTEKPLNLINARAETLFSKTTFRQQALNRRCIIIADSFYEWNKYDKSDYPRRIMKKDESILSLAGIWNATTNGDGQKIYSAAIITTEANNLLKPVHDRMPVILNEEGEKKWLNLTKKDPKALTDLLVSYPSEGMKMYKVSKLVNSPKNDNSALLSEINGK